VQLRSDDGKLGTIHPLSAYKDPFRYPLLFPHGDDGYHLGLRQHTGKPDPPRVTQSQYARYRLHERAASPSTPASRVDEAPKAAVRRRRLSLRHRAGKLYGEYILDLYLAAEASRLTFLRLNQTKVRADLYCNAFNATHDGSDRPPGRLIVLSPSFTTGPRHYASVSMHVCVRTPPCLSACCLPVSLSLTPVAPRFALRSATRTRWQSCGIWARPTSSSPSPATHRFLFVLTRCASPSSAVFSLTRRSLACLLLLLRSGRKSRGSSSKDRRMSIDQTLSLAFSDSRPLSSFAMCASGVCWAKFEHTCIPSSFRRGEAAPLAPAP